MGPTLMLTVHLPDGLGNPSVQCDTPDIYLLFFNVLESRDPRSIQAVAGPSADVHRHAGISVHLLRNPSRSIRNQQAT